MAKPIESAFNSTVSRKRPLNKSNQSSRRTLFVMTWITASDQDEGRYSLGSLVSSRSLTSAFTTVRVDDSTSCESHLIRCRSLSSARLSWTCMPDSPLTRPPPVPAVCRSGAAASGLFSPVSEAPDRFRGHQYHWLPASKTPLSRSAQPRTEEECGSD